VGIAIMLFNITLTARFIGNLPNATAIPIGTPLTEANSTDQIATLRDVTTADITSLSPARIRVNAFPSDSAIKPTL
jgi:hypothetical protein